VAQRLDERLVDEILRCFVLIDQALQVAQNRLVVFMVELLDRQGGSVILHSNASWLLFQSREHNGAS
jgi:hypothetical protein